MKRLNLKKILFISGLTIAWILLMSSPILVMAGVSFVYDYTSDDEKEQVEELQTQEEQSPAQQPENQDNSVQPPKETIVSNGPYSIVFNEEVEPNIIVKDATEIVRGGMSIDENANLGLNSQRTLLVNETILLFEIYGNAHDCVYFEEFEKELSSACRNEIAKLELLQQDYIGIWKYNIAKNEFKRLVYSEAQEFENRSITIDTQIGKSNLVTFVANDGETNSYYVLDVNTGKYDMIEL